MELAIRILVGAVILFIVYMAFFKKSETEESSSSGGGGWTQPENPGNDDKDKLNDEVEREN